MIPKKNRIETVVQDIYDNTGQAEIQTDGEHGLRMLDEVIISGNNPEYNGSTVVLAILSPNSFRIEKPYAGTMKGMYFRKETTGKKLVMTGIALAAAIYTYRKIQTARK